MSSPFFILAGHIFLSQSATHSFSHFYIFQFYILISSTSRTQITQVRSSSCQFFHLFIISIPFTPVKNHISIIIPSLSLVFFFCVLILFIFTFFYLLYFITILISTSKSFFVLSSSHLSIFMSTPFFICHIFIICISIINLSLTFYSPLLFLAYFIISPFLPLSSPFFFYQSSSSCSCSSIFLSKYFYIFFPSTFTFSCLLLFVLPKYFS